MKTKQIVVDGKQIGIAGLDEVFEELIASGHERDECAKSVLLEKLTEFNFIPPVKRDSYATAFWNEFRRYCEQKTRKDAGVEEPTVLWKGIQREEIPWFPRIVDDLCDGCGDCLRFCSFRVFDYDEGGEKVIVVNPYNCQVGCDMCTLKCGPDAIIFPPKSILDLYDK